MPKTKKAIGSAPAKPKKPKKKVYKYQLEIEVNGEVTKVETNDIGEALIAYQPPPAIKTKMVVIASSSKKTVSDYLIVQHARRLFANHTALSIFAKNLTARIDG